VTSGLRRLLDRIEPLFQRGGPLERFSATYEMIDTALYSPADLTRSAPHARDGIDLKRVMIYVLVASMPCAVIGIYNVGLQANGAMAAMYLASPAPMVPSELSTKVIARTTAKCA